MAPLATPEELELQTELGLSLAKATQLLNQASATVRAYCEWHIAPVSEDQVVTVDGSGSRFLSLPTMFLRDISAIAEDSVILDLDAIGLEWSEYGIAERSDVWTAKRRGVSLTITHGYDEVPDDIKGVVIAMVARAAASPLGEVRTQTGPFSVTYSQPGFNVAGGITLLDHEVDIIHRYQVSS